jgi:hypothetical protein
LYLFVYSELYFKFQPCISLFMNYYKVVDQVENILSISQENDRFQVLLKTKPHLDSII